MMVQIGKFKTINSMYLISVYTRLLWHKHADIGLRLFDWFMFSSSGDDVWRLKIALSCK